jgi:hypothetical protein
VHKQVTHSASPLGKVERKACIQEPLGVDAAALQEQLRVGSERKRSELGHPPSGGQAEGYARGTAELRHELALWQRLWRREIHRTVQVLTFEQECDGPKEIQRVDPRDILATARQWTAESQPRDAQQHVEDAAGANTHHWRRP